MTDAAFQAVFANVKNVPSRKTVQLVFELPVEQSKAALDVLGGIPDPSVSVHVAIARLVAKPAPDKPQRQRLTSERAAMLVKDRVFQQSLCARYPELAKDCMGSADDMLKHILGITSKRELDDPNSVARETFEKMETAFLQNTGRMAHER
jgi:hypothetical protein